MAECGTATWDGKKKPPQKGGSQDGETSPLERLRLLDVVDGDLPGTAVFCRVEGDLLALDKAAHAGPLESRCVNKHVLAAIGRLNEAEAFLVVVELHGARIHGHSFTDVVHVGLTRAEAASGPVRRFLERESEACA